MSWKEIIDLFFKNLFDLLILVRKLVETDNGDLEKNLDSIGELVNDAADIIIK